MSNNNSFTSARATGASAAAGSVAPPLQDERCCPRNPQVATREAWQSLNSFRADRGARRGECATRVLPEPTSSRLRPHEAVGALLAALRGVSGCILGCPAVSMLSLRQLHRSAGLACRAASSFAPSSSVAALEDRSVVRGRLPMHPRNCSPEQLAVTGGRVPAPPPATCPCRPDPGRRQCHACLHSGGSPHLPRPLRPFFPTRRPPPSALPSPPA